MILGRRGVNGVTLSRIYAAHLLRRSGFAASPAQIDALAALPTKQAAVDRIFSGIPTTLPNLPALQGGSSNAWDDTQTFNTWWLNEMATSACPLREKMTFFWHGHFTSNRFDVLDINLMARQNQLYRKHALGNFRTLAQAMALEPAMLIYLDNARNRTPIPNENFARELLELFILGVGNYKEADVRAAARAWTGHNLNANWDTYEFRGSRHDNGNKTFLGVTRNWNGPDIINHVLTVEPYRTIAARFLARKLWSFFAYPGPDATTVATIANAYLAANLSISALLKAIFLHPNFDTDLARRGLIRTPTEFVVAALRATQVSSSDPSPLDAMDSMGQTLLEPPNVSGWRNNAVWISTQATAARGRYARRVAITATDRGFLGDLLSLAPSDAVTRIFETLGVVTISAASRALLEDWIRNPGRRLSGTRLLAPLVTLAITSPEFQLA